MMKRSLSRLGTRRASLKMKIKGRRNQEVRGGGQLPPSPSYLTQLEVTPIPSNDILSLIAPPLPPRFWIPTTVSVLDDDDDGAGWSFPRKNAIWGRCKNVWNAHLAAWLHDLTLLGDGKAARRAVAMARKHCDDCSGEPGYSAPFCCLASRSFSRVSRCRFTYAWKNYGPLAWPTN